MADAGPDDTTRLVTIFLGANDASIEDQNPAQHVTWRGVNEGFQKTGKELTRMPSEAMELGWSGVTFPCFTVYSLVNIAM